MQTIMPATFLLFLFMTASSILAVFPLAIGLGFVVFSKRKMYGAAVIASGLVGGAIGIGFLAVVSWIFGLLPLPHVEIWILFFACGFSFAGMAIAFIGFFAPLFRVDTRWAARRMPDSDGNRQA